MRCLLNLRAVEAGTITALFAYKETDLLYRGEVNGPG